MTGMLIIRASWPSRPSANRMAPSSMSRTATCVPEVSAAATTSIRESAVRCSVRRFGCPVKDVRDHVDRGLRAHGHDEIAGLQHEVRRRRR